MTCALKTILIKYFNTPKKYLTSSTSYIWIHFTGCFMQA